MVLCGMVEDEGGLLVEPRRNGKTIQKKKPRKLHTYVLRNRNKEE